jgi:hypothetical protein
MPPATLLGSSSDLRLASLLHESQPLLLHKLLLTPPSSLTAREPS